MCACICNLWVPKHRENEEGTIKYAFILLTNVLHIYPPWYRFVLFPHVALWRRLICISLLFSGRCENQVQKLHSRLNKGGKSGPPHHYVVSLQWENRNITDVDMADVSTSGLDIWVPRLNQSNKVTKFQFDFFFKASKTNHVWQDWKTSRASLGSGSEHGQQLSDEKGTETA